VGFLQMFNTFTCKPYLVLLGTALVYAIPTGLVGSFGYFATAYVVCRGDMTMTGELTFWGGAAYAIFGIACVPLATWLSRRLGKKKALTYALIAGLVAFASSWWLYTPEMPWLLVLWSGLNGFSATGLWVILPSMCVDVVDYEEVRSGKRREGAYNATFSWVLKVGMSASMFIVGPLLDNVTGFRPELAGAQTPETVLWIRILFAAIPVSALIIAFFLVQLYPLSPKNMAEIRVQLETDRGKV
jgi:glycoside/pentoside/hexuronide:cation symporter, GPH family